VTKDGGTPLHYACYNGHLEVAKLLLEKGANSRFKDYAGNIPWNLAFKNGFGDQFSELKRKLIYFKVGSFTKQLKIYKTFHVNQNLIFKFSASITDRIRMMKIFQ
jgi:ankyrin repeat protein